MSIVAAIVLMALAVSQFGIREVIERRGSTIDCYETALWARDNVEGGQWAMFDAGFIGLFSEHPTMTLNGLATDRNSMELLRGNRFDEVIKNSDIDYLVLYVEKSTEAWIPPEAVIYAHHATPRTQPNLRLFILDVKNPDVPVQRLLLNAR